jgi:subtilisin family serine protease
MKLLTALVGVALVFPGGAEAARFAVGVAPGTDVEAFGERLEARTGGSVSTIGPFAVALEAPSARGVARMRGVTFVERLTVERRVSFVPTDPFFPRQWHIPFVRGFDAWAFRPAWFRSVRVAIIDSGIDRLHPEFQGKLVAANTFVGGSAFRDKHGHGTFVAGLIAARLDNEGIAGLAFPSQLVVAKVVRDDGVVPLEASAVEYAVRKGALVVAAVGNSDLAREQPWRYASYPAALPQVLGVSALARDGSVPMFSNRDDLYNDIAAPGDDLLSTLPRSMTALRPTCLEQGYSECGPPEFRSAQGTSFASAIVTAGAAILRGNRPDLGAAQIRTMLERSAADQTSATGCRRCTAGRDALSGWGKLDIAAAATWRGPLPAPDRYEPNDDAGPRAARVVSRRVIKRRASIDFWNDQNDVYAVRLRKGERLNIGLFGREGLRVDLALWNPGTRRLDDVRSLSGRLLEESRNAGSIERLSYRVARPGRYFVQVKVTDPGEGPYTLTLRRGK